MLKPLSKNKAILFLRLQPFFIKKNLILLCYIAPNGSGFFFYSNYLSSLLFPREKKRESDEKLVSICYALDFVCIVFPTFLKAFFVSFLCILEKKDWKYCISFSTIAPLVEVLNAVSACYVVTYDVRPLLTFTRHETIACCIQ